MVLVFKTSVRSDQDIIFLKPFLEKGLAEIKWNFDLEDCDKIFRVENPTISGSSISMIFNDLGFECLELE